MMRLIVKKRSPCLCMSRRIFEYYLLIFILVYICNIFEMAIIYVDAVTCPIFRTQPCTPDVYTIENLMNASRRQESSGFILDNFQLTDSWMNPSITRDPGLIRADDKIIMIWRIPDNRRLDKVGYNVLDASFKKVKANDMMEIFYPNDQTSYFIAEDARIFSWNGQLYSCFNHHHTEHRTYHWYTQYYTPLFYRKGSDQFYAKWHIFKFNMEHEIGYDANKAQKNWVPFEYCPKCEYKHGSVSIDFVEKIRKETFSGHHNINHHVSSSNTSFSSHHFNSTEGYHQNTTYHNGHRKSHHTHLGILLGNDKHAIEEVISSRPADLKPASLLWIKDVDPHRVVTAFKVNQTSIDVEEGVEVDIFMNFTYTTKLESVAIWGNARRYSSVASQ